jgi:hypothetical protein
MAHLACRSLDRTLMMRNSWLLRNGPGCPWLGVFACATIVAFSPTPSAAANTETRAGAWSTTIVFDDPSIAGCTSPGLDTSDGGVVAQGCDVTESPRYGQWQRIGHREFAVTFVGVTFGPEGTGINGTYKVRATLQLSKDGETSGGPFLTIWIAYFRFEARFVQSSHQVERDLHGRAVTGRTLRNRKSARSSDWRAAVSKNHKASPPR